MRLVLLSWLLCVTLTAPVRAESVLVFAAASLAGPLDEIAQAWAAETGHDVVLSYAGSSSLARQIEAGAPADVVILASNEWMDHLAATDALRPGTRQTLLTNSLVWIGPSHINDPITLLDLQEYPVPSRIALALTDAVPAQSSAQKKPQP